MKAMLTILLSFTALGLGAVTARLSSKNRERASALDQLQRDCQHLALENERVQYELHLQERGLFAELLAPTASVQTEVTQ